MHSQVPGAALPSYKLHTPFYMVSEAKSHFRVAHLILHPPCSLTTFSVPCIAAFQTLGASELLQGSPREDLY